MELLDHHGRALRCYYAILATDGIEACHVIETSYVLNYNRITFVFTLSFKGYTVDFTLFLSFSNELKGQLLQLLSKSASTIE